MQRPRFEALITRRWITRAIISCVLIGVTCTLSSCGSTNTATTSASTGGTTTNATTATAQAKVVPVALHLNEGSYSVSGPGTTISGSATKGAVVTVNGHEVGVRAGHWHEQLSLHLGSNRIAVSATMAGHAPAGRVIDVTRHRSEAELEALARARALRAEAKARQAAEARERQAAEAEKHKAESSPVCTNGTYVNAAGNTVCRPEQSPTVPPGATAQCEDGSYSFSQSRSGTCSHHGGVARWLTGE
jgi:hypothetical protein